MICAAPLRRCRCSSEDSVFAAPAIPYNFSNLLGRTTEVVTLARSVCIEPLRELVLCARVHARTIGTGASIVVRAFVAGPSRWQPDLDFVGDDVLATLTVDGTSAPGTLLRAVFFSPLPSHVQLQLLASQPSTVVTIQATLSVELSGKR